MVVEELTLPQIAEDFNLQQHLCKNLQSHNYSCVYFNYKKL
jgi:hypothetical protein